MLSRGLCVDPRMLGARGHVTDSCSPLSLRCFIHLDPTLLQPDVAASQPASFECTK